MLVTNPLLFEINKIYLTFEQKTTQSMHNSLETSIIFLTGFEAMNK